MEKFDYVIVGAGSAGCVLAIMIGEKASDMILGKPPLPAAQLPP